MKDDKQNFVLFAVIAALILFGWPMIQGKFFPTANPPVTRIEDGKSKPIANPAADPAAGSFCRPRVSGRRYRCSRRRPTPSS